MRAGNDTELNSSTKAQPAQKQSLSPHSATWNWARLKSLLARPVDGASLAFFRISAGIVMALEAYSLLRPSQSTSGRVMLDTYYTGSDVTFHFPYAWFEWLPILPAKWIYILVALLGLGGITIALGFCYRVSAI